jgi:lysophospholipase L1-like esterase
MCRLILATIFLTLVACIDAAPTTREVELPRVAEIPKQLIVNPERSEDEPVILSIPLPEGSYRVEMDLIGVPSPQPITVKSESRRLMIDRHLAEPDIASTQVFNANLRTPALSDGGAVELNDREIGVWHWNERLELEIHARLSEIKGFHIRPVTDEVVTIYLAGDSTVTDQPEEPWAGWGQMLPAFFGPDVVVANHAESGLALSSFRAHRRFEKILESIQPGDYLFIQFGHNDQKEQGEGIGPWDSYSDHLRFVIGETRAHGAIPVLVTSMQRRRFDAEYRQFSTLGEFPLAMRRVAAELDVPLIDLNQMSATLYAALGPEGTKNAFVHYPAGTFPRQEKALKDDTHFNAYGAYELARCVVEGIRLELPRLAEKLRPEIDPFDPATPDPFEAVNIPLSPGATFDRPLGN